VLRRLWRLCVRSEHWQRHDERRAFADAGAFRGDVPLMQLDDVSRDRQTEPEAGAFRGAVALTQTLEHMRQKRRVDPLTFVAHGDADFGI